MNTIISVIGAGTMGSGIAQVAGIHGCQVNIIDSFPEALENSQSTNHSGIPGAMMRG